MAGTPAPSERNWWLHQDWPSCGLEDVHRRENCKAHDSAKEAQPRNPHRNSQTVARGSFCWRSIVQRQTGQAVKQASETENECDNS